MDRSLAHDLRGVIAAAASNIEFVRAQPIGDEIGVALTETAHELRVASDIVALLGAQPDRTLEIDLRAAILAFRGESALAVDATEPPFAARGTSTALAAAARQLCLVAERGRARIVGGAFIVAPVDVAAAEALLATAVLPGIGLEGMLTVEGLVLRPKN
jgi:hypothetical protein